MKNKDTINLIKEMRTLAIKQDSKFWRRISDEIERPRKKMRVVNISKLKDAAKKGEITVVPGKVIGDGKFDGNLAAFQFSESVKKNNKVMMLDELMKKCPKGQKCRIIG